MREEVRLRISKGAWVWRGHRDGALTIAAAAGLAIVTVAVIVGGGSLSRGTPAAASGPPHFVEETGRAGLEHMYSGGFEHAVGGGVAVFDCNADGRPDLYVAGGSGAAALYRNDSAIAGALRFTRVPDPATNLMRVNGAYPIDLDGDGIADLTVLRDGENVLLRGLGGCRFERANERWGFDGGSAATTAFSATWEPGASLPTLAIGNYVDPTSNDPHHLCFDNELHRPASGAARYGPPARLAPGWCALSMLFSDWDRSGHADLRVSNDAHYYLPTEGEEQLWRMRPAESPRLYGADDGWVRVQVQGMGIASYDLSEDGYPDVFLTSQADNRLQTLALGPSQPTYRDIGLKRGVNAAQPFAGGDARPSTAWHPEFADVNNDGLIDLYISKGNVAEQPEYAQRDPSDLLIGQADGTFREAADIAGVLSFDRGRGAALADFNLDGLLDLIEVNYGAPVRLWRNVGSGDATHPRAMGSWLAVSVAQPGPNADAIGAWVEVRAGERVLRRELTIGGGHSGGQLGWVHFGLGDAAGAEVRITWPGGEAGPWMHANANEFVVVTRGAREAKTWSPGAS